MTWTEKLLSNFFEYAPPKYPRTQLPVGLFSGKPNFFNSMPVHGIIKMNGLRKTRKERDLGGGDARTVH